MSWLPEAIAEVAERQQAGRADPPTYAVHPQSVIARGEADEWAQEQRQQQGEQAEPAA